MPTILSDHDVEGHVKRLVSIWTSAEWIELWQMLDGNVETFANLGLSKQTSDADLWLLCQERQIVLVTGNRNAEDDASLERASERWNQPDSLPVVTIGDPDRVLVDRRYAERVAGQILEIMYDLDNLRGTRRLFVP